MAENNNTVSWETYVDNARYRAGSLGDTFGETFRRLADYRLSGHKHLTQAVAAEDYTGLAGIMLYAEKGESLVDATAKASMGSTFNPLDKGKVSEKHAAFIQDDGSLSKYLAAAAIAFARTNIASDINDVAGFGSDDNLSANPQTVAAMGLLAGFYGNTAKALNDAVPGRKHPDVPFMLDEDYKEDVDPAATIYREAREIFHKTCIDKGYLPYDMGKRIETLGDTANLNALFAPAVELTQNHALKDTYEQNLLFVHAAQNMAFIKANGFDSLNQFKTLSASENIQDKANANLAKANRQVMALKAMKEGVNLLQEGFSASGLRDLETAVSNKGITDISIGTKPKEPNRWVKFWNRMGFYKNTMQTYTEQLDAYNKANQISPSNAVDQALITARDAARVGEEYVKNPAAMKIEKDAKIAPGLDEQIKRRPLEDLMADAGMGQRKQEAHAKAANEPVIQAQKQAGMMR